MSNKRIAIIGGTGLDSLKEFEVTGEHLIQTAFGSPSAAVQSGSLYGHDILFLPRHGTNHKIPPHKINYRANIEALAKLQVAEILAVTAVGGIADDAPPKSLVIPDQIIDYSYGREHTFYDGVDGRVEHVDFSKPFDANLRNELISAAKHAKVNVTAFGVYGVTQGPRLETAAEIQRLSQDGCTLVGMTAMPEAALAREREIAYANCSIVVNWAAGIEEREITMDEIKANLSDAYQNFSKLLHTWLSIRANRNK